MNQYQYSLLLYNSNPVGLYREEHVGRGNWVDNGCMGIGTYPGLKRRD